MVAPTCNLSIWEAEPRRIVESSRDNIGRPCLQKPKKCIYL
jgi:hypothetical protein